MTRNQYREMVKILTPLIGKPLIFGEMDCVNLLRLVYEPLGASLPTEFEGLTWETYAERWKKAPDYSLVERFLMGLGRPIEPNYLLPGDLLIISDMTGGVFPAIALINSKAVTVDRKIGVMVFPTHVLREIKAVRRIV